MPYTNQEKARYYDWWVESGRSYAQFTRRVRKELGRSAKIPDQKTVKDWQSHFREEGSVQRRARTNTRFVFKM